MTKTTTTILPNTARVLVKLLSQEHISPNSNILLPGQLKAGENLLYGEIVHPGGTQFKKGQHIYYSEYSASALFPLGKVESGELTIGEAQKEENKMYVIAEDDIMAYEQ